jgi:hypothetical protein
MLLKKMKYKFLSLFVFGGIFIIHSGSLQELQEVLPSLLNKLSDIIKVKNIFSLYVINLNNEIFKQ